ncbi:uncharacterized protein LOC133202939 [Saccostrea echinata]|uniref:uncharacterized protein LOC133202939 n=1 Tax=Saccostrea echinata TaxID=191078 RepID=UPI002A7F2A52|nr:uncharacterized protein LOC133202939 [Saccostrea echinata]
MCWLHAVTFGTLFHFGFGFDLNDPKTNLESVLRISATLAPHVDVLNYINGTVYGRRPGETVTKLFSFEGYNIGQKYPTGNGDYMSLSREFVVYRDIHTGHILQVFQNPYSGIPNEVFYVANDPVNGEFQLGDITPFILLKKNVVAFNLDFVLEYPNALDPGNYPKYSAGKFYNSAELFSYFANYSALATTNATSVDDVNTWSRHSQFLPWLEMGTIPGSLFYTTLTWKCESFSCVSRDVMELINSTFPKYRQAPKTFEEPNETSWTQFKKVVDKRRAEGKPDILIPTINVTRPEGPITPTVDGRILQLLMNKTVTLNYNGSSFTQIYSQQSVKFFNVEGQISFQLKKSQKGDFLISLKDRRIYKNVTNGKVMTSFSNPLTNTTVDIPSNVQHMNLTILADDATTMEIPKPKAIGLLMTHSKSITFGPSTVNERWSVTNIQAIFQESLLQDREPYFYGTISQFSSWPVWMKMNYSFSGNLVTKVTFGRLIHDHHQ